MDTWSAQLGEQYVRDGRLYQVVRITPAGASGTSRKDGPIVHLKAVREDGTLSDFTADVWTRSISYPASAYEPAPRTP